VGIQPHLQCVRRTLTSARGGGLGGGFLEMQGIQRTTDMKRWLKSSRLTWPRDGVNIGLRVFRLNPLEPPKVDFEASRKLRSPAPLPKF